MSLAIGIKAYLDQIEQDGLLRTRQVKSPEGLHFDSNDYLTLSNDSDISNAYSRGFLHLPHGSGGSMLLSGYHQNHQRVERSFAEFLEVDECLLISSGYAANLAVCALLGAMSAHCFIDKSVHASMYDGLRLSQVAFTRFLHNNIQDLSYQLAKRENYGAVKAVLTEGVFSMSGQYGALADAAKVCDTYNMDLIVDEAHSFGVVGRSGRGAVDFHGLSQSEVPLRIIPLGKAAGVHGAIIAGRHDYISGILQSGRSLIYSTSMSPAFCDGLLMTLEAIANADKQRQRLNELIQLFKHYVTKSVLTWTDSDSPIQQLLLGTPDLAIRYSQELKRLGIYCSAIRPPTVPSPQSGLRVVINSCHTPEHIAQLFKALQETHERLSN
jgi:8-amino-7-oxononanoate synthase